MGGRGTNLNVNSYLNWNHEKRTSEFHSVYQDGNIKFLKQNNDNPVNSPIFSNTPGRIYVTITRDNKIKEVAVYDKNHKIIFTISPGHYNEPELHEHGPFPERKRVVKDEMKKSHIDLYNKIINMYNKKVKNIL